MTDAQIIYELLRFIPQFFFAFFGFYFVGQIVGCPLNLKLPRTWLIILGPFSFFVLIIITFAYFLPYTVLMYICRILFVFGFFIIGSLFYFHTPFKITCGAVLIFLLIYVLILFFLDFTYTLIPKIIPAASPLYISSNGVTFENLWVVVFFYNIVMSALTGLTCQIVLKTKAFIILFINQLNLRNIIYLFLPASTFMVLIYYIGSAEPSVRPTGITDIIFCLTIVIFVIALLFFATQNGRIRQLSRESQQIFQYVNHLEEVMSKTAEDAQHFKTQLLDLNACYQSNDYTEMEHQLDILLNSENFWASRNRYLNALPTGGLKGLVFMKLLEFEKNHIAVDLIFDKDLSHLSPQYLKESLYYDICKIAGTLLDNAQEAAILCTEPEILIEIYEHDHCLYFSLSNSFCQPLEPDKIALAGYTTKGEGHGYGLRLAHQIISSHSELTLDSEAKGSLFTQTLYVKI